MLFCSFRHINEISCEHRDLENDIYSFLSPVFFLAHLSGSVGFHLFQYFGITVTDKHILAPEQPHRLITNHSQYDMVRAAYLRQV